MSTKKAGGLAADGAFSNNVRHSMSNKFTL